MRLIFRLFCLSLVVAGIPSISYAGFDERVAELKSLAQQGDAEAPDKLGSFYDMGFLQPQSEAITWYRLAADRGNTRSMVSLGPCTKKARALRRTVAKRSGGIAWPRARAMLMGKTFLRGVTATVSACHKTTRQPQTGIAKRLAKGIQAPNGTSEGSIVMGVGSGRMVSSHTLGSIWQRASRRVH